MGQYLNIPVGEKGNVLVDITPSHGLFAAGGKEKVIDATENAFQQAVDTIHACAATFFANVQDFADEICPQEFSMEFGLSFGAEGNVMVSKATAEANFKVSMTWKDVK